MRYTCGRRRKNRVLILLQPLFFPVIHIQINHKNVPYGIDSGQIVKKESPHPVLSRAQREMKIFFDAFNSSSIAGATRRKRWRLSYLGERTNLMIYRKLLFKVKAFFWLNLLNSIRDICIQFHKPSDRKVKRSTITPGRVRWIK